MQIIELICFHFPHKYLNSWILIWQFYLKKHTSLNDNHVNFLKELIHHVREKLTNHVSAKLIQ